MRTECQEYILRSAVMSTKVAWSWV
jgi:hypothetical protein